ncbi:type VI secretion system baseplate subunit TssF, partial [Acinetobacter baumannii]
VGSVRLYKRQKLLCSNRDLPHEALGQSNNVLNLNDSSLARRAIVLKRPTKPYKFEQGQSEQWRVISHLSLNSLALMKGDAVSHVKELLALYNLSLIHISEPTRPA